MQLLTIEAINALVDERGLRVALVFTALDLELQAVMAHVEPLGSHPGRDGAVYECGLFHALGQSWLIVVAETGAGNHQSQSVMTYAHIRFDPDVAIFVGIAGSRKSDVPIGSVVACDLVYFPYGAKYGEKGRSGRPRDFPVDSQLLGAARKVRRDRTWTSRIIPAGVEVPPGMAPVAVPPLGFVAPIVSTEAVSANPKSELEALIAEDFGDACLVEMEGYGALHAAVQERKPGIVIRGVSDMTADKAPNSDGVYQPIAASHAAAFAFELLDYYGQLFPKPAADTTAPSPTSAGGGPARAGAPAPATRGPISPAPPAPTQLVLNLAGTPDAFGPRQRASVETMLQSIAGSTDVRIVRVDPGSVRLVIDDPGERLAAVGLAPLRDAFAGQSMQLEGLARAAEVDELDRLAEAFRTASGDLLGWPEELPGGGWLDRPELDDLVARVTAPDPGVTALIGAPGAGKSALLARLARQLDAAGRPVLAIKADLLPTGLTSEAALAEHLGLAGRVSDLLLKLAAFRPVVLVIDQLDALAGYVDLHTGRLSVLLNLVRRLGGADNIAIVLSARRFEYEHDVRLSAIKAQSLELELPAWSAVIEALEARGLKADGWPADAQEVIRAPQALSIYLQLPEALRAEAMLSYQALLDRLWASRASRKDGAASLALAADIAEMMAEAETLWLPASRLTGKAGAVEALEGAGILTRNTSGLAIGFAHQTMFEYALARGFAQGRERLSSYALERQGSLFVRPKLWAGLTYLRGADRDLYHHELTAVWRAPALRRHLRRLLVDFMGQQAEPTDVEALFIVEALDRPGERAAALRAVAGSGGWLRRLASGPLVAAMRQDGWPADRAIGVLVGGWPTEADLVETLLEAHWLPSPANDLRLWRVAEEAPRWSPRLLGMVEQVLARTPINPMMVDRLIGSLGDAQPEVAVRLVRASLDAQLDAAFKAGLEVAKGETGGDSSDRGALWGRPDPRQAVKRLTEDTHSWDTLPVLAQRAPAAFINSLWPWFEMVFVALSKLRADHDAPFGYPLRYEADFRFSEEGSKRLDPPALLDAVAAAVAALANDPDAFRRWAAGASKLPLMPVQRLVAHGLAANPEALAGDALAFLLDDSRRLYLGAIENMCGTAQRLVESAAPHWSGEQIGAFEAWVWQHPIPGEPSPAPEVRRARRQVTRRVRVALLRALPARRASAATRRQLVEEARAGAAVAPGVKFGEVGFVGSPMSAKAMTRASDAAILKAFEAVPDAAGWDHPRGIGRGGNIQLSRAFAAFARDHPGRALGLIGRLPAGKAERAAGYALDALAEVTDEPPAVAAAILALSARGFALDEFRNSAAAAARRLLARGVELDDALLDLFGRWLVEAPPPSPEAEDEPAAKADEAASGSLIWSDGGFTAVPGGHYPYLELLAQVYLGRGDMAALERVIEAALAVISDPRPWHHFLLDISWLSPRGGKPEPCRRIIELLLGRAPGIRGTREFAMFLARVARWAPDLVERELERWREGGVRARRGYGEIAVLLAALHPDRPWPREAVAAIRAAPPGDAVRTGATTSAVQLWSELEHRHDATRLLIDLLPQASADEWLELADLFRVVHGLTPDADTLALLEAIGAHLGKAPRFDPTFVVMRLGTLLPHGAPLVAEIIEALIAAWRDELGDIRTAVAASAPELVDLALTLHRLSPDTREAGLRIFEALLDVEAYTADATLEQIDNRFRQARPLLRRRLPRRQRRAPRAA